MNERIEEFYKQSFIEVQDENSFPCMTSSKQKFTELIVRECADVATVNQYQSYTVGHYVLKHFGVE